MRILVTGSRDWPDWPLIGQALDEAQRYLTKVLELSGPITLIHGGAAGADHMADVEAGLRGWRVEVYPADWKRGRGAGIMRNLEMINLGADICLAFIHNSSRGASHCADAAETAGILVWRYRE